jgi:hypothetical protein
MKYGGLCIITTPLITVLIDDRSVAFQINENPQPIPEGISVHVGAKGADCDVTCANANLHCAPNVVQAISSCDLLREHFECEAGCAEAKDSKEVPAYVVYGTPKPLYPTMCFIASPEVQMVSCNAAKEHLQRLCACSPWKLAESLVSKESGEQNDQHADIQQGVRGANGTASSTSENGSNDTVLVTSVETTVDSWVTSPSAGDSSDKGDMESTAVEMKQEEITETIS